MAEIARFFRRPLGIDQHRQITADADRIHVVEEVRAMPAQQILNVVLRRGDDDVDAGLVHQPVEALVVERNLQAAGGLRADVHGLGSRLSGVWMHR